LTGDLIEQYRQGRSKAWYRRQVFWAVLAEAGLVIRRQSYAMRMLAIWWGLLLAVSFQVKWPVFILAFDPTIYWLFRSKRRAGSFTLYSIVVLIVSGFCLMPHLERPAMANDVHSGAPAFCGLAPGHCHSGDAHGMYAQQALARSGRAQRVNERRSAGGQATNSCTREPCSKSSNGG
jgi:hypothetical protein